MVISVSDKISGLKGFIGIHSTKRGPALGGTRFLPYDSESTALADALNLSKAMSFKCALANLPFGGGKAVIMYDKSTSRERVLKAYARTVDNLGGLFKTGTDVGITDEDVQFMGGHTSHMLGLSDGDRTGISTGSIAALGTYWSIKASFKFTFGSDNLAGKTIGVKGLGKLGGELVRLLTLDNAIVVAADADDKTCRKFQLNYPKLRLVSPNQIAKQPLDLYAPCALGNEFNPSTIPLLKTSLIAGGANNQLADQAAGDTLWSKGILYAPDYIVNAGGLIYVADELEPGGFNRNRVLDRTKGITDTLLEIFKQSHAENKPTNQVADEIGLKRINQKNQHDKS